MFLYRKESTLRTATQRKAQLAPSPAEASENVSVAPVLKTALASLEDSKAEDITSIDIQGKSALADYMIVASGRSQRHVSAMSEHLLRALKDAGFGNVRVEGLPAADWVLVDAGDLIIHLFRPEVREFYSLEKMWSQPDLAEETLH